MHRLTALLHPENGGELFDLLRVQLYNGISSPSDRWGKKLSKPQTRLETPHTEEEKIRKRESLCLIVSIGSDHKALEEAHRQ